MCPRWRVPKEKRMSYAQSLLAKDEEILYRDRQHWLAPISDSLKPFVLVLVSLVLFFAQLKVSPTGAVSTAWLAISAIVLLVGLVWIGIVIFSWRAQEYLITTPVSYTHLRAHETVLDLVCRLLLEKKKKK